MKRFFFAWLLLPLGLAAPQAYALQVAEQPVSMPIATFAPTEQAVEEAPEQGYALSPTSRRTGNRYQQPSEYIKETATPAVPVTYPLDPVSRRSGYIPYADTSPRLETSEPLTYTDKKGDPKTLAKPFHIYAFTGYSGSSFIWNIGHYNVAPYDADILSELTWKDMHSRMIGAGGEYRCDGGWCDGMMVMGSVYANRAYKAENQDSDYYGNGRTQEFSRSNNDAKNSTFLGLNVGFGYDFAMMVTDDIAWSVIPKLGYTYDVQEMRMTNGLQTIPADGPFNGLNSRYQAEWDGPYAGLETRVRLFNDHELRSSFQLTKADYKAGATWNLRTDFAQPTSYNHYSEGFGRSIGIGYSYWYTPDWEFRLDAKYEFWKASDGVDVVHFITGVDGFTRFNEAKYKAHSYTAGIGYRF